MTTRHADRFLIAMFLFVISVPLVAHLIGVEVSPTTKFEAHVKPQWQWNPAGMLRYAHESERYFNRNFPFREPLIALHARIKLSVFGVTSSSDVTIGKDGWLFYAGQDVVPDFQRVRPFTPAELDGWAALLTRRQAWLAARAV